MKTIDIFIVTFYSDLNILDKVLQRLNEAVCLCSNAVFRVTLIDNSHGLGQEEDYFRNLKDLASKSKLVINLHKSPSNLGFGQANNLAFDLSCKNNDNSDYILVLNPDAFLSSDSLNRSLLIMSERPELGILLPRFLSENGQDLYLAKRYPTIWVLFLRGFAPTFIKRMFQSVIHSYDLRDFPPDQSHLQAVVGSGACFLMRASIWRELKGFDPRFFLYFEDFDITYRARQIAKVAYEPSIEVIHLGGHTAKKGRTHIKYFIKSAGQFFNKHGWKWL